MGGVRDLERDQSFFMRAVALTAFFVDSGCFGHVLGTAKLMHCSLSHLVISGGLLPCPRPPGRNFKLSPREKIATQQGTV